MSASSALRKPNPVSKATDLLREQLECLKELNSLYPATQIFLQSCGVTQVSELSKIQRLKLKAYLVAMLASTKM